MAWFLIDNKSLSFQSNKDISPTHVSAIITLKCIKIDVLNRYFKQHYDAQNTNRQIYDKWLHVKKNQIFLISNPEFDGLIISPDTMTILHLYKGHPNYNSIKYYINDTDNNRGTLATRMRSAFESCFHL